MLPPLTGRGFSYLLTVVQLQLIETMYTRSTTREGMGVAPWAPEFASRALHSCEAPLGAGGEGGGAHIQPVPLAFRWCSLEAGMATGPGTGGVLAALGRSLSHSPV